jgi:hypothetical protein
MKLTKVAETIIAEDSGDLLCHHIVELEKDKDVLQCALDQALRITIWWWRAAENLLLSVSN